jgi:external thioesterase TEII
MNTSKKPQLFLFHFAGGNCYSFEFMKSELKDFDVTAIELPGRGKRINENLLKDFDLAALDLFNQVRYKLRSPTFLIYGHSMGAYLGLTVSHMLEKAGRPPAALIVSGNAGPGISINKKRYLMDTGDLIEELKILGGVPLELIENAEYFNYFEPVLRADFEIAENYKASGEHTINAPLYALMGSEEDHVKEIANWGQFTRSEFRYEILEGNHFFITRHPQRIAFVIRGCIGRPATARPAQQKINQE